jgi:hypothetical protein
MASPFFMRPLLKKMEQGVLFKVVTAWLLRIIALQIFLAGSGAVAGLWYQLSGMLSIRLGFAGGIASIFILVSTYMIIHTLILRSSDLLKIPASGFTILPILSLCLKLIGELLFCILVPVGTGVAAVLPLAGDTVSGMGLEIPYLPPMDSIPMVLLTSAGLILTVFTTGLIILGFFYLISELIITTVTIARHAKVIRKVSEQYYNKN